ncbi:hypothetical protein Gasu2_57930 [Galdieria sulphuraria]|uniref:Uncharacterized protein n=1 Tax=Galdieria sulphuraria TaxID=130081 RepID=M2WRE4_GALSU|nr:hypothetical protein Gasu_59830 isoform 1 [Galdieria sulphuraria]EME26365.1 hypothetical protein isoform 1 [Galdieria sulphuraria]GJD11666.1 hypothetical protein Gasu2_57930 [Galdieria sulphuraria]|eukprot:XP_005702885.1 hypothetical protein isoform 1 [Galdieria sulphuraria]
MIRASKNVTESMVTSSFDEINERVLSAYFNAAYLIGIPLKCFNLTGKEEGSGRSDVGAKYEVYPSNFKRV